MASSSRSDPAGVEERLRALRPRYHDHHPFHQRMNAGELSPVELRRWVVNRYAYQAAIPRKDAAVLANCPDPDVRRQWVGRISDHDGSEAGGGGTESWLRLGEALGAGREELRGEGDVLPGVRFAVDAYVEFCRSRPWPEAVASSLTELFGPEAMRVRVAALQEHYPWIDPSGLEYFRTRLSQAPRDAGTALALVKAHCQTPEAQDRAVNALAFKCDVLWAQLDAIERGDTRVTPQGETP